MRRATILRPALLTASLLLIPFGLSASVDSDLLSLLPPGAQTVASIDIARAQASTFGQFVMARMNQDDQHLDQFTEQTGFDPRRDLEHLVFASFGPSNSARGSFVVLARGIYDSDRINAAARSKGSVVRPYHGYSIITNNAAQKGATGLVFPQPDIAIFGDLGTVRAVLDNSNVRAPLDARLQDLIDHIGPQNDAWFATIASGDSFTRHFALPGTPPSAGQAGRAQAQALQSIRESSGGVHFGDTVNVSFDALTRSPQDAASLADVVRFGASFVQMQRSSDPKATLFAAALDKMDLETSGDSVHIAFSLPEKDVEQLAALNHPHSAPHH